MAENFLAGVLEFEKVGFLEIIEMLEIGMTRKVVVLICNRPCYLEVPLYLLNFIFLVTKEVLIFVCFYVVESENIGDFRKYL